MKTVDPREEAFLQYMSTELIDPTDPAAPRWIEHCVNRVTQCREIVNHLARYVDPKGHAALDVGCQTGALGIVLAEMGADVTAIDVGPCRAARIRSQGWGLHQHFAAARSEALPFRSASFDIVMFIDVIEHVEDASRCLREIVRVLRPGGILVLQGPNRFSPEWFFSDPHYGLFGASVLPPSIGKRYVEWRRGRKGYDVGTFPIGHQVVRTLKRIGCTILEPQPVDVGGERANRFLKRLGFTIPGPPVRSTDPSDARFFRRCGQWFLGHLHLAIGSIFTVVAQRMK